MLISVENRAADIVFFFFFSPKDALPILNQLAKKKQTNKQTNKTKQNKKKNTKKKNTHTQTPLMVWCRTGGGESIMHPGTKTAISLVIFCHDTNS